MRVKMLDRLGSPEALSMPLIIAALVSCTTGTTLGFEAIATRQIGREGPIREILLTAAAPFERIKIDGRRGGKVLRFARLSCQRLLVLAALPTLGL